MCLGNLLYVRTGALMPEITGTTLSQCSLVNRFCEFGSNHFQTLYTGVQIVSISVDKDWRTVR